MKTHHFKHLVPKHKILVHGVQKVPDPKDFLESLRIPLVVIQSTQGPCSPDCIYLTLSFLVNPVEKTEYKMMVKKHVTIFWHSEIV